MTDILEQLITLHFRACGRGLIPAEGQLGMHQKTTSITADELQQAIDRIKELTANPVI